MFARARVGGGSLMEAAGPGQPILSQMVPTTNVTAGSATLTANQLLSGYLQRSGPGAGYTDTWPTADGLISAMLAAGLGPQVGDQFPLIYQNTVAFAMTFAAGTGIIAGVGTLNVAASVTRIYYHTLLSTKPQTILVGDEVNTDATLNGFTAAQLATIMPGMGITGTGVPALTTIIGVSPDAGTIEMSANATATNNLIAFTIFPRIRLDSIGTLAA